MVNVPTWHAPGQRRPCGACRIQIANPVQQTVDELAVALRPEQCALRGLRIERREGGG